uniref:Uncharacterized protein n=1 Tax=Entomoneis paludosa TaxID=265537 RepID=A0A7S2YNG9_9STRA|mmetsp:Transcript_40431/g.84116  ORF Transcript_40431/g.84116 Transcript_40431/m.84116 type:complete len:151 (+) Transcript_40431:334-786(+)
MESGKEVNGFLPPLGRPLNSGVDCYFESADRLVQNLVEKTGVNIEDACWALEACKGDLTEAWTSISIARQLNLNADRVPRTNDNDDEEEDWDGDSYDRAMQKQFEKLKENRITNDRKRRARDYFKGGEPDEEWLPRKNPKPLDDEPWFTG